MRIAQVAPLAESVPPKFYGGTERVVAWLTEELIELGHEVTLFASGDSRTRATLVPIIPRAIRLSRPRPEPFAPYAALLEALAEAAADFDVVHCHLDWLHLPMLRRSGVRFLTTLHGRLDLRGLARAIRPFLNEPFVSISDNQRLPLPDANWIGTVYHGMPSDLLPPCFEPEAYLAFLGRISPEKGPEAAMRLARAAGVPLRVAAKIPRADSRYFKERIEPLADGEHIQLIGELDEARKGEFLRNATALLFPIDWPEPFGLVMIEAMACGTPVIAFRRGSVPEVIEHGVTGFIVENEAEGLDAIRRIGELDRRRVRAGFERRFTARQMAENYVKLYTSLARQPRRPRERPEQALVDHDDVQRA